MSPSDNRSDGQLVSVSGAGFPVNSSGHLRICDTADAQTCSAPLAGISSNAGGTFGPLGVNLPKRAPLRSSACRDVPSPGDFGGNGATDIAVFRPPNGQWFVVGQSPVSFGLSTDIPLPLPAAIRLATFP